MCRYVVMNNSIDKEKLLEIRVKKIEIIDIQITKLNIQFITIVYR